MAHDFDVLIVGGGPAGLAAALVLGRCLRRVLVCDAGHQRNLASHAIHALPGHEGKSPADFLREARDDLKRYPSVMLRDAEVTHVQRTESGFSYACGNGTTGSATTVLLATGLVDKLPQLPGIHDYYGRSVHHCLYCDGAEYADRPLVAYGEGDKAAGLAFMMSHWSSKVVACCEGPLPDPHMRQRLANVGIECIQSPVSRLISADGKLTAVALEDGTTRPCEALFFSTGCEQGSSLFAKLGCERDEKGALVIDADTEATSQPGVYAAGDISRDVLLVAVAIGEGAKAGVAINRSLLRAAGLL